MAANSHPPIYLLLLIIGATRVYSSPCKRQQHRASQRQTQHSGTSKTYVDQFQHGLVAKTRVLIQACGGSRTCHTTGIGESYTAVGCIGVRPLWRPRVDAILAHPDLFPKAEEGSIFPQSVPKSSGQSQYGRHNLEGTPDRERGCCTTYPAYHSAVFSKLTAHKSISTHLCISIHGVQCNAP